MTADRMHMSAPPDAPDKWQDQLSSRMRQGFIFSSSVVEQTYITGNENIRGK
jgi:hypothetical protein